MQQQLVRFNTVNPPGNERDAIEYVRLIRESSSNWRAANRAAFELASLIQNDTKLAKAQEDLRAVLTVRQEATMVMMGMLP